MKQLNRTRRQRSAIAAVWPRRREVLDSLMKRIAVRLKREPMIYQIDEFAKLGRGGVVIDPKPLTLEQRREHVAQLRLVDGVSLALNPLKN
jgi:hypothetical protein